MKKKDNLLEDENIIIKYFSIKSYQPNEFIIELEKLCEKFSINNDYFFRYEFES